MTAQSAVSAQVLGGAAVVVGLDAAHNSVSARVCRAAPSAVRNPQDAPPAPEARPAEDAPEARPAEDAPLATESDAQARGLLQRTQEREATAMQQVADEASAESEELASAQTHGATADADEEANWRNSEKAGAEEEEEEPEALALARGEERGAAIASASPAVTVAELRPGEAHPAAFRQQGLPTTIVVQREGDFFVRVPSGVVVAAQRSACRNCGCAAARRGAARRIPPARLAEYDRAPTRRGLTRPNVARCGGRCCDRRYRGAALGQ